MMNTTLLLGLGALGYWLVKKKSGDQVITINDHTWVLRAVAPVPGQPSFTNVLAPKGSWGPHNEMLVVRFSQTGPSAPRLLAGVGADVPVAMRDAALKDLAIKPPGA